MGLLIENVTAVRITGRITDSEDVLADHAHDGPDFGACQKVIPLEDFPETVVKWNLNSRVIVAVSVYPAEKTTDGNGAVVLRQTGPSTLYNAHTPDGYTFRR